MNSSRVVLMLAGTAVGFSALSALAGEPVSRDEVRAVVAEMLADAETRSSLLAGGGDAGYDKHFFMASADGNYRLNVSGFVQIRYTMNFRSNNSVGFFGQVGDDFNPGFSLPQVVMRFSGNVVNPDLTFQIEGLFDHGDNQVIVDPTGASPTFGSSGGGTFSLQDAWVNYRIGNGWSVRGGQYKSYFLKEDNNRDEYTMSAGRGMTSVVFGQAGIGLREQGIGARYRADNWWVGFDITDGFRTQNTDFTSLRENDIAATGRFEWRFAGTDDQLKDYTSMPGEAMGAMIGGGLHYQSSTNDPAMTIDQNYLSYTVDGQIEGSGLSLFAAFVGSHTWRNAAGPADPPDADDFGVTVQGAWRFMANDEIFARYDGIYYDKNRGLSPDAYNFITFGYNHYFAGHAAKLTVDCVFSLQHTHLITAGIGSFLASGVVPSGTVNGFNAPPLPNTNVGLLGARRGLEAAVRVQFQLMF